VPAPSPGGAGPTTVAAMDSWKRPYIAYFMFAAFLVVCGVVLR
jgi:hypothetical protein